MSRVSLRTPRIVLGYVLFCLPLVGVIAFVGLMLATTALSSPDSITTYRKATIRFGPPAPARHARSR